MKLLFLILILDMNSLIMNIDSIVLNLDYFSSAKESTPTKEERRHLNLL